jgi:hypothetical protein
VLFREFAAARQRDEREHNRDVRMAWMTNSLARHKRLPRLADLLVGHKAPTRQSGSAMVATMHALAAAHGFKFTPGNEVHGCDTTS